MGSTTGNPTPKQTFPAATPSREHLNKHNKESISLKRPLSPRAHEWYPTTSPVQQHVSPDYNRANSLQDESFQRLIENHERQNQAIQQLIQQQQQGVLALTLPQPSGKMSIFPNGLTHGFGPKMAIFLTFFFLGNIGQENVFYHILERKNTFLGYKNMNSKKSKN